MPSKTFNQRRLSAVKQAGPEDSQSQALVAPSDLAAEEALWLGYKDDFYQHVFAYVQGLTADETMAKEVSQLAFCRLWEDRHGLSDRQEVEAFLYAVARTRVMTIVQLDMHAQEK